jgi:hypothetical protein
VNVSARKFLAVLIVAAIAIGLRFYAANTLYIDYDEPVYLNNALEYTNFIREGHFNWLIMDNTHYEHPAFYKIVYGVALLVRPQVFHISKSDFDSGAAIQTAEARYLGIVDRYVSVLFSSATVVVLAILNPLAGLALAIDTLAVKYGASIYLESLPMLTNLLAALAYLFWFDRERRRPSPKNLVWLGLTAVLVGMSAASKYYYALIGPVIGVHFILMVILKKIKPAYLGYLVALGLASLVAFFVFDPYLWPDPISNLNTSLSFFGDYAKTADEVARNHYPFWQSLTWLTAPFTTFFGMALPSLPVRLDQVILFFAVVGLPRLFKKRLLFFIWLTVGVATLLVWTVKWPQYTMVILTPFCFSAGEGASWIFTTAYKRFGRFVLQRGWTHG